MIAIEIPVGVPACQDPLYTHQFLQNPRGASYEFTRKPGREHSPCLSRTPCRIVGPWTCTNACHPIEIIRIRYYNPTLPE